jgi:hypothetical protein
MKRILLISILFVSVFIKGQQDFILYHMPSIPQITQVDPASMPDSKLDIGLPIISSVYGSMFNTGFSFGDIFAKQPDGSFTPNMNFILDSKKMKDNNFFILNGSTDLLFVGFKKNNNFYSFNITEKFDFTLNYPRDLVVMALEGNGNNLLGKRASFDGLGIDFTHWREYAVHWVHDVDHKFSYGARLKYLYGMENFSTDVSYMGLTTDQNTHALTFDMNFDLRSSGLPLAMIGNDSLGRKKALGAIDTDDADMMAQAGFSSGNINNYMFNRKNTGLGIDLGFNYHLNDKVLLEFSALDLGFINWNSYTANSRLQKWDYTYSGIDDPITVLGDGAGVDLLKQILEDSIDASFMNNYSYNNDSYRTYLRSKIYASVEYIVDHNNFVSLSLYSSFVRKRWRRGLGIAYNYHFKNFLSATASYSIYNRSYSNLGLGLSLNLGCFEVYFLTDNVLSFGMLNIKDNIANNTSQVDARKVRNGQFHAGINLTFGREKSPKKIDEDPNRAAAVPQNEDSKDDKSDDKSDGSGGAKKSTKTVYPTGKSETSPIKRTDYNDDNGKSKQKNTSTKKLKTNYNKGAKKKDPHKRKGQLVPAVGETETKGKTFRKVSDKF